MKQSKEMQSQIYGVQNAIDQITEDASYNITDKIRKEIRKTKEYKEFIKEGEDLEDLCYPEDLFFANYIIKQALQVN